MKRGRPPVEPSSRPLPTGSTVIPFRAVGVHAPRAKMSASNKLEALFDRLTSRQRSLIFAAADTDKPTPHSIIRQIAELESAIGAVADLWAEGDGLRR